MTGNVRADLMPYIEGRALEDVAFGHGLTPTRFFALMLPVWQVEVKATVTEGRPYAVIDRYVERGIVEAGFDTVAELAGFLALDHGLVAKALRVLEAVGHVVDRDGRFLMTELGRRSHRDQICYVVEHEDRREMYFDAFSSRPLTRAYYDSGVVTLLTLAEVKARATGHPRFLMLDSVHGFRREALAELAAQADRDRYNLPIQIDQPQSLGEKRVYLPLYVVRALDARGRVRFLAYSQAADVADPDLSVLCESTPEIARVLESEELAASPDVQRKRMTDWLGSRNLGRHRPTRDRRGAWEVVLPPGAFGSPGGVPLARLGSFAVLGTDVLRIRCDDETTRKDALLARMKSSLGASSTDAEEAAVRTVRVSAQLELPVRDLDDLRQVAIEHGEDELAARVSELLAEGAG